MLQVSATRWMMLLSGAMLCFGIAAEADAAPRKRKPKPRKTIQAEDVAVEPMADERPQEQGVGVVVLKFETFDTDPEVMALFYKAIQDTVRAQPELRLIDGGEVTLSELSLTLGCAEPDEACLDQARTFLKADQVIYGSVQRADAIHLFTIKMYDFESRSVIRQVEDQTVQGDMSRLAIAIPALVNGLLLGDVGALGVKVSGVDASQVQILLDGKALGSANAMRFEGLPLGEHVVTARSASGKEQTQRVILSHDQPANLNFSFVEEVARIDSGTRSGAIVPGWISVGVGVIGLGFGAYSHFALSGLEDDARDAYPQPFTSDDPSAVARDLESRQDAMNSAYTNRNIGLSVGAAGLVLGAGLLIYGYLLDEAPSPQALQLNLAPTPGGAAAGVAFEF